MWEILREAVRGSWPDQGLVGRVPEKYAGGTYKRQCFGDNVWIFDSTKKLLINWSFARQLRVRLTSSTRDISDVISNQHPQFMVYLCTLRMKYSNALSSFFSLASTIPYLTLVS